MTSKGKKSVFDRLSRPGNETLSTSRRIGAPILPWSYDRANKIFSNHHEQRLNDRRMVGQNKMSERLYKSNAGGIPSLFSIQREIQPQPFLNLETVEKLRTNFNSLNNEFNDSPKEHLDFAYDNLKQEQELYQKFQPVINSVYDLGNQNQTIQDSGNENIDINEYLKKERETKQQIEDIIKVAQGLKEKLRREEEMKLKAIELIKSSTNNEQQDNPESRLHVLRAPQSRSISNSLYEESLQPEFQRPMNLKPHIPSLLDINVPPPPVENVLIENFLMATNSRSKFEPGAMDTCWNCEKPGHRFMDCKQPKSKQFCFHCGRVGFDVVSCPYCNKFQKRF